MRLVREAHGVGKGVIPGALVVNGVALWIAGGQRLDQRALRRGDAAGECQGSAGLVMGAGECGFWRRQKLSPLIDRINDRYGRCSIGFGLFHATCGRSRAMPPFIGCRRRGSFDGA